MIKRILFLDSLLIALLFITGCASLRQKKEDKRRAAAEELRPSWIRSTVGLDAQYYWGTAAMGLINGQLPAKTQIETIRKRAYADIASQISVKVASQTTFSNTTASEATKSALLQNMQQTIRLSAEQYLDGVELVEKYSDEFGYFELYRLSITKQQEQRRRRIDAACDEAIALLDKAIEYRANANYRMAIISALKVLHGLSEYANDDISSLWLNRTVNPLVEADKLLVEFVSRMRLSALHPMLSATLGQTIDAAYFGFRLTTPEGTPISGVKLTFKPEGLPFNTASGITNAQGVWSESVRVNSSTSKQASLTASVDMLTMVASSGVSSDIAQIAYALPIPSARLLLTQLPPQINILTPDNTLSSRLIKTVTEKEFVSRGFERSSQAPSLTVLTSFRTERRAAYLSITLEVLLSWKDAQGTNRSTTVVLNESDPTEQGALEKAIAAYEKELKSRVAQQVIREVY